VSCVVEYYPGWDGDNLVQKKKLVCMDDVELWWEERSAWTHGVLAWCLRIRGGCPQ